MYVRVAKARAPRRYGVALVVGTWNYPIMLCLVPVAGAIAAGNTVILKPSNVSPACARLMARLFSQYMDPAVRALALANAYF